LSLTPLVFRLVLFLVQTLPIVENEDACFFRQLSVYSLYSAANEERWFSKSRLLMSAFSFHVYLTQS